MRTKTKETTNSRDYKIRRKIELEQDKLINCSRCKYHRKDNEGHKPRPDKHKNINRKSIRYGM